MQAGVAKIDITPPLPVHLVGYSKERVSSEVHDPLSARALLLEADGRRVALLAAELLWLERRQVRAIRAEIERLCGLPPESVLVAATHTHAGPDTIDWYDFAPVDQDWLAVLTRQLAGAVWLAAQRLRPVRAERVRGHVPVGINRRQQGANGPRIGEDPSGVYDDSAVGLRLIDESESLLASVVCAGVHPVSLGFDDPLISADWPGVMCTMVEQQLGGTCLFVNGACGDINPRMWGVRGRATMERLGRQAGGAAIELLAGDTLATDGPIGGRRRELTVPHQDHPYLTTPLARRLAEDGGLTTEVQALSLGPLSLISMPGECLTETGWQVQRGTQLPNVAIAGYANDYVGYLPLPHIYEQGGYEPSSTMLPADSVLAVAEAAVAVGDELAAALGQPAEATPPRP